LRNAQDAGLAAPDGDLAAALDALAPTDPEDAAAAAATRHWLAREPADSETATAVLQRYAAAQAAVDVGGAPMTRLAVLGRLAEEPSPQARRTLFHALDPVWRTIADDYPAVLAAHPRPWPVAVNALALGPDPSSVELSLVALLEAWRSAAGDQPEIEPCDWWWRAGTTARALRDVLPLSRLLPINSAYYELSLSRFRGSRFRGSCFRGSRFRGRVGVSSAMDSQSS
jgi:hypothetical protein